MARLRWVGHVIRMWDDRTAKKALESNFERKDGVQKLGVTGSSLPENRLQWRQVVESTVKAVK